MVGPARPPHVRQLLLATHQLTADERDAQNDEPRPGAWFGDEGADGRPLDQLTTESLIRGELISCAPEHERAELVRLLGKPQLVTMAIGQGNDSLLAFARHQRGGIDSEPLVRLLAFRCWGARDRGWPNLDGMTDGNLADHLGK